MAALPAYMRIRQYVVDLMLEHTRKDVRIMSERELCKKFNVTRPTARRALKELIDEGCLSAKPGLGTFINSAKTLNSPFALRKTFKVMVIFGSGRHTDLDGFFMNILARVCDQLKYLPIRLRMATLNLTERALALEELQMYNPDGIIWVRPNAFSMDLISAARKRIPVYTVGSLVNGGKCHITTDYYQCGRLLASWFLDRKRKNIIFTGATPEYPIKSMVYNGWRDEFAARGIPYNEHLQVNENSDITSCIKKLFSNNSIDGIFTFGSEFAAVDIALSESGIDTRHCPVLLDENYFGLYGAQIKPAAKLIMFPDEIIKLAVENLFKALNDQTYEADEIVLSPRIENL